MRRSKITAAIVALIFVFELGMCGYALWLGDTESSDNNPEFINR